MHRSQTSEEPLVSICTPATGGCGSVSQQTAHRPAFTRIFLLAANVVSPPTPADLRVLVVRLIRVSAGKVQKTDIFPPRISFLLKKKVLRWIELVERVSSPMRLRSQRGHPQTLVRIATGRRKEMKGGGSTCVVCCLHWRKNIFQFTQSYPSTGAANARFDWKYYSCVFCECLNRV